MAGPSDEPTEEPTGDQGDQRGDGDGPSEDPSRDTGAGDDAAEDRSVDPDPGGDGDGATDTAEAATDAPPLDVSEYTTDRRTVTSTVQVIWAVHVLAAVAVVTVIAGIAAAQFDVDTTYVLGGGVALAALGLVWVHLRYRVWSYRVRDDALYLERGVVTHVKTVAPYVRIQHVDTQRGPLERALGLSTLVVYTAGSRGADVSIPGLRTDAAADLQQRVKELAIESEGGDAL